MKQFPLTCAPAIKYQQGPLVTHFAFKMEVIRISRMSVIQPISAWSHQPETVSTLTMKWYKSLKSQIN